MVPTIHLWMEQIKWYVPGWSNLKEYVSPVSIAPERNSAVSLVTVCGSSSLLVQVTVAPALMVAVIGANMKSLITICAWSGESTAIDVPAAAMKNMAALSIASRFQLFLLFMNFPSRASYR